MEKQISISLVFIKKVKDAVVRKLKCNDDFELHKTFEGLLFYKKHLKKLVGIYFTEKMFKVSLINETEILKYHDEYEIDNKKFKIIVLESEENINIGSELSISYIILHSFNDFKFVKLIGIIESEKVNGKVLNLNEIKKYIN